MIAVGGAIVRSFRSFVCVVDLPRPRGKSSEWADRKQQQQPGDWGDA